MTNLSATLDAMTVSPWNRYDWGGNLLSIDGTAADDFERDDVAEVVAQGDASYTAVAIVRLKDGRFASWEANWDVTGDGFCRDAYGGDADIMFAASAEVAARGLSEASRDALVWTVTP